MIQPYVGLKIHYDHTGSRYIVVALCPLMIAVSYPEGHYYKDAFSFKKHYLSLTWVATISGKPLDFEECTLAT